MGESFNTVQLLEPPFLFVDERVIFIPRGRRLEVKNTDIKFIFFIEGKAQLLIDGQSIGTVQKGDLLIVPRRCTQTYVPLRHAEERLHVMRIYLDYSSLRLNLDHRAEEPEDGDRASDPEVSFPMFLKHHFKTVRILPSFNSARIHEWIRQIRLESERPEVGYRHRIATYCRLLATEAARGLQTAPALPANERPRSPGAGVPASWSIEHVKQFLFENYARPLTLAEIARDVNLSAEHLCRRFKEETKQTVFSYLREMRIEAAKAYILSSKHSVTEIASRCGFSSATLFCRVFRSATGQPPLKYRRSGVKRISFHRTTLTPDDVIR